MASDTWILQITCICIVDTVLGFSHEVIDGYAWIKGILEDTIGCLDEVPLDGLLLQDPDVILDIGPCSDLLGKGSQSCRPSDLVQCALLAHLIYDSKHIYGSPFVEQIHHRIEDASVTKVIEG